MFGLKPLDFGNNGSDPYPATENGLSELRDAGERRTAAGEKYAGVEAMEQIALVQLGTDDGEEFLQTRVDYGVERSLRDHGGLEARHGIWHGNALHGVLGSDDRGGRRQLKLFRLCHGDGKGNADVVGDKFTVEGAV